MFQSTDLVLRQRPPWLDVILPRFERCRQRILAVTDGLSFSSTAGFGLGQFLDDLHHITPEPTITTAVRGSGPVPGFVFDSEVTIERYDQIWLFGINGAPLDVKEIVTLWEFMEAGGGVFATGDHETLGYDLCGEIPRVRKMRDWQSVPMVYERIDTVTNPGVDRVPQFDDQSDEFPQRIFPHYSGSGSTWFPHPLLRSPLADIDVLPDHPHESVCLVGPDLDQPYTLHGLQLDEFPVAGTDRLMAPQVVASSVSAGRYLVDVGKPPTTPRLFGAISVWDGQRLNRGRVVCDATWHHFLNVNLSGAGTNRPGLAPEPRAQIGEYYRNIADWLIPANRRWCRWWIDSIVERYRFPLFEEFRALPKESPWEDRVALGRIVEPALEANRGRGYTAELVAEALTAAGLGPVRQLVMLEPNGAGEAGRDADAGAGDIGDVVGPGMVGADELRFGVAGSVFDALVRDLPPSVDGLDAALDGGHDDKGIASTVAQATGDALRSARETLARRAQRTMKFLETGWPGAA